MIRYQFFSHQKLLRLPPDVSACFMHQKHTNHVRFVSDADHPVTADAMVTTQSYLALCVKTSDCLPILIYDPIHQVIAAIHAGWRGVRDDIITNAINLMVEYGADTDHLQVHIGPSVRSCCYEVYGERAEVFKSKFFEYPEMFRHDGAEQYLDLATCAHIQLKKHGVKTEHIKQSTECTSCSPDMYPSYHRDASYTDTMISTIWIDSDPMPVGVEV